METPLCFNKTGSLKQSVLEEIRFDRNNCKREQNIPNVVPAECMLYLTPLFFINRWTSAICFDTLAVGVPIGIRQKSAVHFGGVESVVVSVEGVDILLYYTCVSDIRSMMKLR